MLSEGERRRSSLGPGHHNAQSFSLVPPPLESPSHNDNAFLFPSSRSTRDEYFPEPASIREEDVREALLNESKKHKHWKAKAVRQMNIYNIEQSACLHYRLETFTEMRSTSDACEPSTMGQFIEHHGMDTFTASTINPWEYEVFPSQEFADQVRVIEMPGTSRLAACPSCNAEGVSHCFHCRGYGTDKSIRFRGTGMKAGVAHPAIYTHPMIGTFPHADMSRGYPGTSTAMVRPPAGGLAYGLGTPIHFISRTGVPPPGIGNHDLCYFCHGRGVRDCHHCKGHGKRTCTHCGGSSTVRQYTKLKVFFSVDRSDFYLKSEIPEKLLTNVLPLTKYPNVEITEISRRSCAQHLQNTLGKCRVLKQRHLLESIPIAKVSYRLGKTEGTFWLYGQEHLCFVPKYPSKCSIL